MFLRGLLSRTAILSHLISQNVSWQWNEEFNGIGCFIPRPLPSWWQLAPSLAPHWPVCVLVLSGSDKREGCLGSGAQKQHVIQHVHVGKCTKFLCSGGQMYGCFSPWNSHIPCAVVRISCWRTQWRAPFFPFGFPSECHSGALVFPSPLLWMWCQDCVWTATPNF